MARVVLVSRTLDADVAARAKVLAETHEVEVLALPVPDAQTADRYFTPTHAYAAAVWKEIARKFAGDPPARIEFAGPPGDAVVTVQARVSGEEMLAGAKIAVGARTVESLDAGASLEERLDFEIERYVERNCDREVQPVAGRDSPLVSVIIPYFKMAEFVERTVDSVFAQDYRPIEVIIVNDGSFRPEDEILFELAERHPVELLAKPNGGVGSARNFGIAHASGRYVLPLDADNLIHPGFIGRAVGVLEARPEVAYVTAWSTYVDPDDKPLGDELGYQPISNELRVLDAVNTAGDALAVIPRSVFQDGFRYSREVSGFEDRLLYRQLAAHDRHGVVIPERLIDYRVRADSMFRSVGSDERETLMKRMDEIIEEGETTQAGDRDGNLRGANLELSRELIAARSEIESIRGSLRWRLLRPFEGWVSRLRGGG